MNPLPTDSVHGWKYTPQVQQELDSVARLKETDPNMSPQRIPGLYDVTARDDYPENRLPKFLRLAELMFKMQDMREKLDIHYVSFLNTYVNNEMSLKKDTVETMPMCTVMQDAKSLTWSSSARGFRPGRRRVIEAATKELNEYPAIGYTQESHKTKWACAEQGCQNAIAREQARINNNPEQIGIAERFRDSGFKALSLMSQGQFYGEHCAHTKSRRGDKGSLIESRANDTCCPTPRLNSLTWTPKEDQVFDRGCSKNDRAAYGCSDMFNFANITDLADDANLLLGLQHSFFLNYKKDIEIDTR
ncbi:hypothetical protein MMC18_002797 [Xylographa bjoerkii]|nr:hypothetical protein [Xylographa bjoerkii]